MHAERLERNSVGVATTIPGAEYAVLATGHLAALEQPGAFATVIESFLLRRQ